MPLFVKMFFSESRYSLKMNPNFNVQEQVYISFFDHCYPYYYTKTTGYVLNMCAIKLNLKTFGDIIEIHTQKFKIMR